MKKTVNKILVVLILSTFSCNYVLGQPDLSYNPGDYQYDDASSYQYDYGPDSSYSEEELTKDVHKPEILSQPRQIQVELAHTIRLPCIVDRLPEALQILWTRVSQDHIIIVMGERILAPAYAKRANVTVTESGSTLVIASAKAEDAGVYKCSVTLDGDSRPEIVHTVSILGPATSELDEPEVINAKEGDDVILSCTALGLPTPHLTWTREGRLMPDGRESIAGKELTLDSVSPKDGGTYKCTADNVSNIIIVNIEYKPTVEPRQGQMTQHSAAQKLTIPFFTFILLCFLHLHLC